MTQGGGSGRGETASSDLVEIVVWDLPIRLFHWLAVALIGAAYATWRLNWMDWHAKAGYALLALLLFRLLWGFFGAETARFSRFLAPPGEAARHLAHMLRREPDRQVGHNPAGGWMALLLIALMLGQTLSGLYVNNDIADQGPLTEHVPAWAANAINALHDSVLWWALLAAAAVHILAIVVYAAVKRHNLAWAMVTGRKTLARGAVAPHMASTARALTLLAISLAATAKLVNLL